jgi:DNA repair protein RadC
MQSASQDLYKISEVELIYKSKVKASERPQVTCADDVYKVLMSLWDENKIELVEQFHILLLNQANRVIGASVMSTGGMTGTVADIRLMFATALKARACKIIIAHNHPSGNLTPSGADTDLTRKVKEAGEFLDLRLLDHLIVSKEGYYSFEEQMTMYPKQASPF